MYPSVELPRPPVPYAKGWKFRVQAHVPPPPTPVTYNCCQSTKLELEERRELGQLKWCLRHPPLPGDVGTEHVHLEVLDTLRVGDDCNAQVLTAKVLQASPGVQHLQPGGKIVAKIYDPLYFNDEGGYINPFRSVDKHYTHEVRAYDVLSDIQGRLIPRFYGSYTMDLPVEGFGQRTVRLILVDYIPGKSMLQASPQNFSQSTRKQIMKSIVDFETLVYQRDIALTDLSPRNVVMVDKSDFDAKRDLVFIDFAAALFGRRRDDPEAKELNLFLGQYISPLLRWTRRMMVWEFNDWIDWDWRRWVEAEYADTARTIAPEMREVYG